MACSNFSSVLSNYRRELGSLRMWLEDFQAIRKANDSEEQGFQKLTALEVAQFQLAIAFASSSLFFTYLKTQGYDVKSHPVSQDLLRVQQYMRKVAAIVEQGDPPTRSTVVDSAAAKRVVAFHTRPRARDAACSSSAERNPEGAASEPATQPHASQRKRRLDADLRNSEVEVPHSGETSEAAVADQRAVAASADSDAAPDGEKEAGCSSSASTTPAGLAGDAAPENVREAGDTGRAKKRKMDTPKGINKKGLREGQRTREKLP
ncbi:Sas10/Utp3/C1D family protein [Besnoitia besnoiti]|uniref:Nuclear nucleic acid-binding protein C1D n=1 Tax=Besnoitia besnoiti TaxID=94643 RepID=A0A2A9M4C8_BESBE|nr:Sas10/Utp3/C1D family protein [Besnoitia besnoiti]PFH31161.1 Sas10/Utp3/C1D family protein [Besnoitia besnoiti]